MSEDQEMIEWVKVDEDKTCTIYDGFRMYEYNGFSDGVKCREKRVWKNIDVHPLEPRPLEVDTSVIQSTINRDKDIEEAIGQLRLLR
jgi:hypothetical protein